MVRLYGPEVMVVEWALRSKFLTQELLGSECSRAQCLLISSISKCSLFSCYNKNTSIQNFFSFRINRVDGSEAGDYKCTATNDAGTATAMANLVVQVKVS